MYLLLTYKREDSHLRKLACILMTSCFLFSAFFSSNTLAQFSFFTSKKSPPLQVIVNDTYINMHTGPGRGFPAFHVLEKGETVTLLYSKTDWIKVVTNKGIEGWVSRRFMDDTTGVNGETVELGIPQRDEFSRRQWEMGVSTGAFDNSIEVIGVHAAYRFTNNLSAELRFSQATGRRSSNQLISWGLMHQPFPEWRLSPFFAIANGQVDISANGSASQSQSGKDNFFMLGAGFNYYLTHRFMARIEYNNYTTLPDRDKNGNIDEWRLGVTAFF